MSSKKIISSSPFQGLTLDNPQPGGFARAVNVEIENGKARQRNPREIVDQGLIIEPGAWPKSIFELETSQGGKFVFIDVPTNGGANLKIMAAVNSTSGNQVELGAYTLVKDGLTGGDSVSPCYAPGQGGAYRVDGVNPNYIIENPSTVHTMGVSPPTAAPTFISGDNEESVSPPLPPGSNWSASFTQTTSGAMGYVEEGKYKLFFTYIKQVDGVDYESAPSDIKTVTVTGGNHAKFIISFPASDEEGVTNCHFYRTLKNPPEDTEDMVFYRMSYNQTIPHNQGTFYDGKVDDALLIAPQYSGTIDSLNISQYFIYYNYIKKYPDGRVVYSSPSPPLMLQAGLNPEFTVGFQPSTDLEVTHIRFYRNLFNDSEDIYYRIIEISNIGSQVILNETDEDLLATLDILQFDNDPPPQCKFVKQAGDRMIYLGLINTPGGENQGRYSKVSEYEHCPALNLFQFDPDDGSKITGAAVVGGNLVVFKKDKTRKYSPFNNFPSMGVSSTIGCIDHRTIQNVSLQLIAFLSLEGVMIFDGSQFKNISKGRIQQSIIQGYVKADAEFFSAYYAQKNQYHLLMYIRDGNEITHHHYLVCDLDSLSWTEMKFQDENGIDQVDVCLGFASDLNGRSVPISACFSKTNETMIFLSQYDAISFVTLFFESSGIVPDISILSQKNAWDSIANPITGDIFFIGENPTHVLFFLQNQGTSYGSELDQGIPAGVISLIEVESNGSDNRAWLYGLTTDGAQVIFFNYSGTFSTLSYPDIDSTGVFARHLKIVPLSSGALYNFLIPDPDADIPMYDPQAEYSEGDIVWGKDYSDVLTCGVEVKTVAIIQAPDTYTVFLAWRYPECLTNVFEKCIYIYDQAGDMYDNMFLWFSSPDQQLGSIILLKYYKATLFSGKLFTIHAETGISQYDDEPSILADYFDPGYDLEYIDGRKYLVKEITGVYWTSIPDTTPGDPFFFTEQTSVKTFKMLDDYSYYKPFFGFVNGSTLVASYYYLFEFGDAVFSNSFYLASDNGIEYLYFVYFLSETENYWVSRIPVSAAAPEIEHIFLFSTKEELSEEIDMLEIRLFVRSPGEIYVFNGLNIRRHSGEMGWAFTNVSQDFAFQSPEVEYWPYIDGFFIYQDPAAAAEDSELPPGIFLMDRRFNLYKISDPNSVLPTGLLGFSFYETSIICCHPGYGTVYLIDIPDALASLIKNAYLSPDTLVIYGIKVELQSTYIDLGNLSTHLKSLRKIFFNLESFNMAIGQVSIEPSINLNELKHSQFESAGPGEPSDILFCRGIPSWISENFDFRMEPGRLNEIDVYLTGTTSFRWSLTAGDMMQGVHSGLSILPPSFQIQLKGKFREDENE